MRNLFTACLLIATASPLLAQGRWKEIGKTSSGNSVYIDPRSVKTVNGIINARVRVKFDPPVQTPQGAWVTSQTLGMFDCARQTIAAKQTIYYADERANKIVERKVNAKPGFGPALGGSMAKLALDYVCSSAGRTRR